MSRRYRNEMNLALAAYRLSLSWHQTWRLLLTGRITGRKVQGRWWVNADSVDRFLKSRQRDSSQAKEKLKEEKGRRLGA